MKASILGVSFDNLLPQQAVERAQSFLENDTTSIIFTPNPEMVMMAQKDAEFAEVLAAADLVVPDGIGVVWASRFTKSKISQRVPGIDLLTDLFNKINDTGHTVYFLGASPGVAEVAATKMCERFPGLVVCGHHHGYFGDGDDAAIIADINASKADVVVVGLNFPKQEKWIYKHKDQINAKIIHGGGGSIDVFAGKVPRAPKVFQKLGLEWLFRLLRQPSRLLRQTVLIKFVLLVVYKKIRGEL